MAVGKVIDNPMECGPAEHGDGLSLVQGESKDIKENLQKIYPELCDSSTVFRPRWVCKQSTTYMADAFVIVQSDGLDPIFGQINEILVIGGDCYFWCFCVQSDDHYHAYHSL